MKKRQNNLLLQLKNDEKELDTKSIQLFSIAFSLVGLLMCGVNVAVRSYVMAATTGGISIVLLVNLLLFRLRKNKHLMLMVVLVLMLAAMLYYLVSGGQEGFSYVWLFLVPPVGTYFFGLYYGGAFSLVLGILSMVYLWSPLYEVGYTYTETFRVRFPIVYLCEAIMCMIIQYRIWNYKREQKELLERAEEASRAKSDFLANMSHEIRTPMNAIMGMCELTLNEKGLTEEIRENCNNIHLSGRNLLGIINELLDFSKIESGKMELVCDTYSMSSLLNDVINMAMARKGDKPIEFMVDCDPCIPDKLYGDEMRIRQVMVNLLTNAIKFTNEGGILLRVSARKESYGINLIISVKDSGIGIKKENLQRIFHSFSQVDTKKNRAIEGTGLGLAISKQLVKKMGGTVQVKSKYGIGTEFTVVIPQKVEKEVPMIQVQEKAACRILCYIDFDKYSNTFVAEQYRILIERMIEGFAVDCYICRGFEEARQKINEGGYTHLFIAKEEYQREKEYYDSIADRLIITVVQDREQHIQLTPQMRNLYKPFYSLSVGSVLNGDKRIYDVRDKKHSTQRFTASKAKILVVDDNSMNLKVALGLLKPYHMTIMTAESGKRAIEMVKSQDYHLIFMDHMMPEMDGVETVHLIREMEGDYFKQVPIVALTANAVSGVKEMFLREGFQGFVAKPIEMSAMERTLRRLLPEELIEDREKEET